MNDNTHSDASTSNEGLHTSASPRKLDSHNILGGSEKRNVNVSGYRFIDMELLFAFVTEVCCKQCSDSNLVLEDNKHERKSCVSHLRVRYESCGWVYTFHTSKKQEYAFDANRRFVYAMRSLGKGHTAAKPFCATLTATKSLPPGFC